MKKPHGTKETEEPVKKKQIMYIILAIMLAFAVILFFLGLNRGADALKRSYQDSYEKEREATYQKWYQKYYDEAEKEFHVKNRVNISVTDVTETKKLEVLKVNDIEYVTDGKEDNEAGVISWLEVPGEAVFVVDLEMAEISVHDERKTVFIRVPYPEIANIKIDYENINVILFKNGLMNGSFKKGEDQADKQMQEAYLLIKKEFLSNQYFYKSAQSAAVNSITYLIKELNPDIEGLVVEVEFFN